MEKAKEILDYLKCSAQERKDYEAYKESLHYQASLYETNYTAAKIEGEQIGMAKNKTATPAVHQMPLGQIHCHAQALKQPRD